MQINITLTKGIPKLLLGKDIPKLVISFTEPIWKRINELARFTRLGGVRPVIIFLLGDNTINKELIGVDVMNRLGHKGKSSMFICGATFEDIKHDSFCMIISQLDDVKPLVYPQIRDLVMRAVHNNRIIFLNATSNQIIESVLGKSIYEYITEFSIEVYSPFINSLEKLGVN